MSQLNYSGSPQENYEQFFVPVIGAPVAKDLMKIAALRPGERVLDVACGTGVVTRLASHQVGKAGAVAGLDMDPGMLAVARSAAPPDMNIHWEEGSAESMPFPDSSFDVVLCQMGLQFMLDKPVALREMRRVLAEHGRLILSSTGPKPQLFTIMGEVFARHLGAEPVGFVNRVFSLHDPGELRDMILGAGFRDVSVNANPKVLSLPAPEEFLWQYIYSTPLAGAVGRVDDEVRGSVEREIVEMWQEFVRDGSLVMEVGMVVATARK